MLLWLYLFILLHTHRIVSLLYIGYHVCVAVIPSLDCIPLLLVSFAIIPSFAEVPPPALHPLSWIRQSLLLAENGNRESSERYLLSYECRDMSEVSSERARPMAWKRGGGIALCVTPTSTRAVSTVPFAASAFWKCASGKELTDSMIITVCG